MGDLIRINYESDKPTVSARDLHDGLGTKSNFTTWFNRMREYGFTEKEFFATWSDSKNGNAVAFEKSSQFMSAKGYLIDYQISIDMAKQICMIQRSEKGKQYREYFLELEKAWNSPEAVMSRALKMANDSIESLKSRCSLLGDQIIEQQKIISELEPKANYVDKILASKSLVCTTQIAKDYGMSAATFNKKLNEMRIQHKVNGQWVLYSNYQNQGYVHSRTIEIIRRDGSPDTVMQTEWRQKGRLFLYEKLKKVGILPVIEREERF